MLEVGGLWGKIFGLFQSFLPSFGLTIIVFTIILKLVLSPLEVYQKISSKKTSEKQAILQPKLEKLQKQYGNNRELLNQKTMELYKKENFNIMGSCLGMLINLVITLVVFITLFSSLNQISQYNIKNEYKELTENYKIVLKQQLTQKAQEKSVTVSNEGTLKEIENEIMASALSEDEKTAIISDAKNVATAETAKYYGKIKEGFLWIKNIYRPDTYVSVFPNSDDFISITGTDFSKISEENKYVDEIYGETYTTQEAAKNAFKTNFESVAGQINTEYSGWNGYLILVVLSALVTVLSLIISTKSTKIKPQYDKKGNEIQVKQPSNKLMTILLPILMIVFTLQYSSAFALYIVVNSLMSVIIGFVTNLVMNKIEKSKEKRKEV